MLSSVCEALDTASSTTKDRRTWLLQVERKLTSSYSFSHWPVNLIYIVFPCLDLCMWCMHVNVDNVHIQRPGQDIIGRSVFLYQSPCYCFETASHWTTSSQCESGDSVFLSHSAGVKARPLFTWGLGIRTRILLFTQPLTHWATSVAACVQFCVS